MVEVVVVVEAVTEAAVAEVLSTTAFGSRGLVYGDRYRGDDDQGCGKVPFATVEEVQVPAALEEICAPGVS
jgi:hypothetical protein